MYVEFCDCTECPLTLSVIISSFCSSFVSVGGSDFLITTRFFETLLGLEVSPRALRECANFWEKVDGLIGVSGRDKRFENEALLPQASDLADPKKFLESTIVPDDISSLFKEE